MAWVTATCAMVTPQPTSTLPSAITARCGAQAASRPPNRISSMPHRTGGRKPTRSLQRPMATDVSVGMIMSMLSKTPTPRGVMPRATAQSVKVRRTPPKAR